MKSVSYKLIRRKGMKNIRLKITENGEVVVSASPLVPKETLDSFVASKNDWIKENLLRISHKPTNSIVIGDGKKVVLFGTEYGIEIKDGGGNFQLCGNSLTIYQTDTTNSAETQRIFLSFLASLCRRTLSAYFDKYYPLLNYYGEKPVITLKLLKSRWGSWDSSKSEMMFNYALCRVPTELAEYVVVHELVHLKIHGHGNMFYALGESLLKGFKILDRQLNKYSTGFYISTEEQAEGGEKN